MRRGYTSRPCLSLVRQIFRTGRSFRSNDRQCLSRRNNNRYRFSPIYYIYLYLCISPFNHTHEIHQTISNARPRATYNERLFPDPFKPRTTVYNRLIKLMAPRTSTKQNSSAGNAWKAGLRFREPAAAIRAAREYAIIFNCAREWRSRSGFPRPH